MGGGSGEAEESDVCRRRRETWRRGAAAGTWRSRREAGISFWSSSSTSRSFGGGIHRGAHAWLRAEWVREMNAVCKKARELRWRGVELFIHSNEAVGDRLVGNWTWSISPLRWRCVWARTLLRVFFGSVPLPGFILTQISQCPPFPRETERTFKTVVRHQQSSKAFTDSCTPSSAGEISPALPLSFIRDAHNHSPNSRHQSSLEIVWTDSVKKRERRPENRNNFVTLAS